MSNGAADDPQFSTIARPGFLTFGQDPNDLTNATGRLPNDRPHVFRATDSHASAVARRARRGEPAVFSGKPWAASTQVSLPQGSRRILLEPRGTRRLSSQSLLDLRVSKTLSFGGGGKVDVMLDALNVLNDSAEEALVSDNLFAATFGKPKAFVDPRRVDGGRAAESRTLTAAPARRTTEFTCIPQDRRPLGCLSSPPKEGRMSNRIRIGAVVAAAVVSCSVTPYAMIYRQRGDGMEPDRARGDGHRRPGAAAAITQHDDRPGRSARRGQRDHRQVQHLSIVCSCAGWRIVGRRGNRRGA